MTWWDDLWRPLWAVFGRFDMKCVRRGGGALHQLSSCATEGCGGDPLDQCGATVQEIIVALIKQEWLIWTHSIIFIFINLNLQPHNNYSGYYWQSKLTRSFGLELLTKTHSPHKQIKCTQLGQNRMLESRAETGGYFDYWLIIWSVKGRKNVTKLASTFLSAQSLHI